MTTSFTIANQLDTAASLISGAAKHLREEAEKASQPPMPSKAPMGWRFTGEYRCPKEGEYYYALECQFEYLKATNDHTPGVDVPRWILRKVETAPAEPTIEFVYGAGLEGLTPPKGYDWLREGGKVVFRLPQRPEAYLGKDSAITPNYSHPYMGTQYPPNDGQPRLILAKLPTIEDIYGKPLAGLKAPEGWEFSGEFRWPEVGETILTADGITLMVIPTCGWRGIRGKSLRLILRKAIDPIVEVYGKPLSEMTPPSGYDWKMEGGKAVLRNPEKGEWFFANLHGALKPLESLGFKYGPHLILTPKPRLRKWVVEETGDVRLPKYGETFWDARRPGLSTAGFDYAMDEYQIVKVTLQED